MSNVRPGDVAEIIWDDFAENVGEKVLVIRLADPDEFFPTPTAPEQVLWLTEPLSPLRGWDDAFSSVCGADEMSFGDSQLRKVSEPGTDLDREILAPLPLKETTDA